MVLYFSIIGVFDCILAMIDLLCNFTVSTPVITVVLILLATAFQFAIDGLFAFLVHILPNKWFEVDNKFYRVPNRERKFYEKLKIRNWKDKLWELGGLGGFSKKSLQSANDEKYIRRFIIESNKGVLTHIIGCFVGFLIIPLFLPFNCILSISLPVAIVNFLLNIPFIFILRYNTPKLQVLYKHLIKTKEKEELNSEQKIINNVENA